MRGHGGVYKRGSTYWVRYSHRGREEPEGTSPSAVQWQQSRARLCIARETIVSGTYTMRAPSSPRKKCGDARGERNASLDVAQRLLRGSVCGCLFSLRKPRGS
jgi:hypothetical protein